MWKILLLFLKKVGLKLMKEMVQEYLQAGPLKSYKDILEEIPEEFVSDGCSYSPDSFKCCGIITDVCRVHDYLYTLGGTEDDRKEADSILRRGIIECACPGMKNLIKTRWIAFTYWRAVRRLGKYFFNYEDGTDRPILNLKHIPKEFQKLRRKAEEKLENL